MNEDLIKEGTTKALQDGHLTITYIDIGSIIGGLSGLVFILAGVFAIYKLIVSNIENDNANSNN